MGQATHTKRTGASASLRMIEAATKNDDLVRDRREQLVAAAIRVFEEKGFHNTTVRDIGRAAALTQGTIYNYVRSKEDILYLVCDRIVTEYIDSLQDAITSQGDLVGGARSALRSIAEIMVEHRKGILMLYHESHNLDLESRRSIVSRVDEFISSFERLLQEVADAHALSSRNVRTLANIVTFLPTIFALRGWGFSRDASNEELVSDLVEFMARGIGLGEQAAASAGS